MDKLNNRAVFLMPQAGVDDDGGDIFAAAIAECDEMQGAVTAEMLVKSLPENWDDRFIPHLWDMQEVITDMEKSPEFGTGSDTRAALAAEGISHIAILESCVVTPDSKPFKLGGEVIKGNSMMVMYSADKKKYVLLHCDRCAYTFAKWLEMMQPEWWDVKSSGFQDPRASLN